MSTTYKFGSVKLTKWQLALLVGTPLAIGMGIYVYRKMNTVTDAEAKPKKSKPLTTDKKSLSIDGTSDEKELEKKKKNVELENEKLSPLQEANMFKNEGNKCYRNGKFDEAIAFYDKAIDKCPKENKADLAIFYQNRAAAYEMLRKWSNVKEDCSKSLECNNRYAKAYLRRAKAFEATNDLSECLDNITVSCLLEQFQNNNSVMYADRILSQMGSEDAKKAMKNNVPIMPSAHFISTYLGTFFANPLQTLVLPEKSITQEKPYGFIRAKQALDEQKYDEIITACTEEIESSESESQYKTEALLLRGTFHLLAGSFNDAKQDFDAVIHNDDADVKYRCHALIKRGSYYVQVEETDLGMADFAEAQKLDPNNPDVYHQRGQIYILMDKFPEAIKEFEMVNKLAPQNAVAFVQKVFAKYRLALNTNEFELITVMDEFKNVIEKFPTCADCYTLLAQVLTTQQQYLQADEFYEKAIHITPDNASLYVHRGILMLQWKGDIEKAVSLMQKAIAIDNKCGIAYESLATIELQSGKLETAIELLEKAIKLAKTQTELRHLYSLRNAAVSQVNIKRKYGISMSDFK